MSRGTRRRCAPWRRAEGWLHLVAALSLAALLAAGWAGWRWRGPGGARHQAGEVLDSLDGVTVHYNGRIGDRWGRSTAPDGQDLGVRYQCVEFARRYYYQALGHAMPDPWGNAADYFDPAVPDGGWNRRRALLQFRNPSRTPPAHGDLLVLRGRAGNPYGHVAIVARSGGGRVEIVQQNAGALGSTRAALPLDGGREGYRIRNGRVLGWLRVRPAPPPSGAGAATHPAGIRGFVDKDVHESLASRR